ncbi:hypothetical protein chiPu_0020457 [Chiloscyllium punctatum]|uniref:Uncharacterized protein n=1 Tax=Chiloscyllium punctatum TaxID=137246 RepID=A0A401RFS7_CHIPU|nr:hypothetical protein [Chiloscyllium punctatum]
MEDSSPSKARPSAEPPDPIQQSYPDWKSQSPPEGVDSPPWEMQLKRYQNGNPNTKPKPNPNPIPNCEPNTRPKPDPIAGVTPDKYTLQNQLHPALQLAKDPNSNTTPSKGAPSTPHYRAMLPWAIMKPLALIEANRNRNLNGEVSNQFKYALGY